jgi:gliding motility-associated-like protein
MKVKFTILYFLLLALFPLLTMAQGAMPVFQRDFTDGGTKMDRCASVKQTPVEYNLVFGGTATSSGTGEVTAVNNGMSDYWVILRDTNFVIKWNKTYGGSKKDSMSLMVDNGDGSYLLAGSSNSNKSGSKSQNSKGDYDYWIVRIDKNGTKLWDATFGGDSTDILLGAELTPDGGYILVGYSLSGKTGDKTAKNKGNKDYWVVKTSAGGAKMWDVTIGGDSIDVATCVLLQNGGYLVGGYSISDMSGDKSQNSFGGYDYWVVQLNSTGTIVWEKTYGGNQDDFLDDAVKNIRVASNIMLAGTSSSGANGSKSTTNYGGKDYWLLRIDSVGAVLWDKNIGGNADDVLTDAIPTLEGSYMVGGYSSSSGSGNKTSGTNGGVDYWVLKITGSGNTYWDRNYGGSLNDSCSSLFQACDHGFLIGGWSISPISGDKHLNSRGVYDYWVVKLGVPTDPNFDNQNICLGTPMNFHDLTNVWPDKWKWNFGDAFTSPETNTSTDQHPIHTYSQSGTYTVTLWVQEGCQSDTMITRKVDVWVNNIRNKVDLGLDTSVCVDHQILLQSLENIPAGSKFLWSTGDTTPFITIDTIGFYSLTVTNEQCVEKDEVEVDYCPEIFIPNAFTPNADGKNDIWYIYGVGLRDVEYMIFDRWGMLLFTGTSQDIGWDGYFKGDLCQIDVYVYKVRYKGITAREKTKYGRISLIR